jgi:hypothetical protein
MHLCALEAVTTTTPPAGTWLRCVRGLWFEAHAIQCLGDSNTPFSALVGGIYQVTRMHGCSVLAIWCQQDRVCCAALRDAG